MALGVEERSAPSEEANTDGGIKVGVRFRPCFHSRPPAESSKSSSSSTGAWQADQQSHSVLHTQSHRKFRKFSHVFGPSATQAQVYALVQPVVRAAAAGVSGAVLAYGQTASGKTHTMTGPTNAPGIIPRALSEVFYLLKQKASEQTQHDVFVSVFELYNDEVLDLLNERSKCSVRDATSREGAVVDGNVEHSVQTFAEAARIVGQGDRARHVAATQMNEQSSRSHCIVKLRIVQSTSDFCKGMQPWESELHFVDLAGSEKGRTRASETYDRLNEGCTINRSLLTLGMVMRAAAFNAFHLHNAVEGYEHAEDETLADSQIRDDSNYGTLTRYAPFRDSKLTRLLQPALGGTARAAVIACAAPEEEHEEETRSTLHFAANCLFVRSKPKLQAQSLDSDEEIKRLREQNEQLRRRAEKAEACIRYPVGVTNYTTHAAAAPHAAGGALCANCRNGNASDTTSALEQQQEHVQQQGTDHEVEEELLRENSRLQQELSTMYRKMSELQASTCTSSAPKETVEERVDKALQVGSGNLNIKTDEMLEEAQTEKERRLLAERRLESVRYYEDELLSEVHRLRHQVRELENERERSKSNGTGEYVVAYPHLETDNRINSLHLQNASLEATHIEQLAQTSSTSSLESTCGREQNLTLPCSDNQSADDHEYAKLQGRNSDGAKGAYCAHEEEREKNLKKAEDANCCDVADIDLVPEGVPMRGSSTRPTMSVAEALQAAKCTLEGLESNDDEGADAEFTTRDVPDVLASLQLHG